MKNSPPKKRTHTSAFGAPGRISHDSSSFYASRLYAQMPSECEIAEKEQEIPAECLNRIFCKSSENMAELPDNSVHLMVTSPPYNVGKEYDRDATLTEYLEFLGRVWREVHRVLAPGGRACINVANLGRKPYIPLHSFIIQEMLNIGFLMRGEVIWNKGNSSSPSTAWGSWLSPSNPTLRDVHEYILIFSKGSYARKNPKKRRITISRDDFLEFTRSVWTIPAVSARSVGHPAPFHLQLPQRLIQLFTYEGEMVLDPFMGSGQTAIAARLNKRNFIGYDTYQKYIRLANKRIKKYLQEAELLDPSIRTERG
jgi:modification methylase